MKFKIHFTPQFRDEATTFERSGNSIIINGDEFDFSPISPGDVLPKSAIGSDLFVGDVSCDDDGDVSMTLIYSCQEGDEEFVLLVESDGVIL